MERIQEIEERRASFAYCSNVDGNQALAEDFEWLLAEVKRLYALLDTAGWNGDHFCAPDCGCRTEHPNQIDGDHQ